MDHIKIIMQEVQLHLKVVKKRSTVMSHIMSALGTRVTDYPSADSRIKFTRIVSSSSVETDCVQP